MTLSEPDKSEEKQSHLWKPGQSGNPAGRPKGSISILTDLRQRLTDLKRNNEAEYYKLIDDYWQDKKKRQLLITMIDGMPRQQTDITTGGEKIVPIFGGKSSEVPTDDSNS